MEENKNKLEIGKFIYWRHLDNKSFTKSYIQNIVKTQSGNLLEISDSSHWTNYPTRILECDIFVLTEV